MSLSETRKHHRSDDFQNNEILKKRKTSDEVDVLVSSHTDFQETTERRSTADDIADARARIAQMMEKHKPSAGSPAAKSIDERIAAAKARIAAQGQVMNRNAQALAKAEEDSQKARGGLAINVHPALLGDTPTSVNLRNRGGQMAPKFSTTLANLNRQTEAVARQIQIQEKEKKDKKLQIYNKPLESDFSTDNPYYDHKLDSAYSVQKDRKAKPIMFNPHGKYIEKAQAARAAAKMEELKRRIEEHARKAGLEEDLDVGDREVLLRPEPPEVEWWDEDFLANQSYDDLDHGGLKLDENDTKITLYIQHPIPIPPPSITHAPPAAPVMMTVKEMAKARRLRRTEEHKDKQAKILLGLLPPDPPKIKLSNLMKVLTSEAVQDPTSVERRVRREVEVRKNKHEQDNEARKLTKEEKHAKDSEKRAADVLKTGLHCCLFRIANLSNPSHRWKIRVNAQQLELTGIVILNPRTNIVVVEGGMKAIKKYKKLMLNRIDWHDNARSRIIARGNQEILGDQPEPEDLSNNTCELIWEGEPKTRNFKVWVGEREALNDAAARKWLGKGAENFWRLAARSESS